MRHFTQFVTFRIEKRDFMEIRRIICKRKEVYETEAMFFRIAALKLMYIERKLLMMKRR